MATPIHRYAVSPQKYMRSFRILFLKKMAGNVIRLAAVILLVNITMPTFAPLVQANRYQLIGQPAGNAGTYSDRTAALSSHAYVPLITNGSALSTKYFTTLPPGSALPSGANCALMIKKRTENKKVNLTYNATQGSHKLAADFFSGDDPRANTDLVPRVDGKFSGTTDEILQWAACKWGIDEDMVRAQAAIESWWHQDTKGDWGGDASRCPPGHGLGADGRAGQCPESWGVLQNRYPYEQSSWPGIGSSTAFNADTAYMIWRTCFEGYATWLNTVDRGSQYHSGDAWGCMGVWFSGRWYTSAANGYIANVKNYHSTRIWETPNFQEP